MPCALLVHWNKIKMKLHDAADTSLACTVFDYSLATTFRIVTPLA